MTDRCLGRRGESVNEEKGFHLPRTKCGKCVSYETAGGMGCCTLDCRRDRLHGNALTVVSERDIQRKEAWGGGHTPGKDQGAISQNKSETLRGSADSWFGHHHGDGLAHLPAPDRFGSIDYKPAGGCRERGILSSSADWCPFRNSLCGVAA